MAVGAAGVGGDGSAGEGQHGGEADLTGREAGGGGGAGGEPGDDVVGEEQCPGFLAGQDGGAPAQDAAGAADGPLQVKERDFEGKVRMPA